LRFKLGVLEGSTANCFDEVVLVDESMVSLDGDAFDSEKEEEDEGDDDGEEEELKEAKGYEMLEIYIFLICDRNSTLNSHTRIFWDLIEGWGFLGEGLPLGRMPKWLCWKYFKNAQTL
jgi:hypothetical protein